MKQLLFFFLAATFVFSACRNRELKEDEMIQEYLIDNNLTATKTDEGLYYIITTEGTGAQPTLSNSINIDYTGTLLDATEFDSGVGAEFPLSGLIEGFKVGMPYFKEGGSGILIIPSSMGYGSSAVGSIPKNSVLRFDIKLNAVI